MDAGADVQAASGHVGDSFRKGKKSGRDALASIPESPPFVVEAPASSRDLARLTLGEHPLFDRPAIFLLFRCRPPARWLVHVELVGFRAMECSGAVHHQSDERNNALIVTAYKSFPQTFRANPFRVLFLGGEQERQLRSGHEYAIVG